MPNSVTKRSSRIAILAVVSVIASLFTFAALPASAATGDVENAADWSACVNAATEDAGFTDTAGHFADAWIDCIGHYGITIGTTPTTYSPGQAVTRAQMALFLTRAAGPAGISVPAATDQGFTDIAGLPQTYQDAINQLAAMDITKGTSTTTYGPNDTVARYQMALFLNRFLAKAGVTFNGTSSSGFTDTGSVSFEAFNAIEDVYDFGITTGTTATTYAPYAAVNRGQMAAFIGRMLGHTNARPVGISFQVSGVSVVAGGTVDVQISVRDANNAPVVDALVDVFHIATADVDDALNADGTCTANVSATLGGAACEIVLAEPASTNASGNYEATWTEGAEFTGATTFWAWTGAAGATFDADTTAVASVAVGSTATFAAWKVTTTVPANSTLLNAGNQVKYGTAVTHTFQLVDADGDPVATAGVDLTFQLTTRVDGALESVGNVTATTDSTGKLSFALAAKTDPNTGTWAATTATDNETEVDVTATVLNEGPATFNTTAVANGTYDVTWNDDPSVETLIVAASANEYVAATAVGAGGQNTATATLFDQYGLGLSGRTVAFTSDDSAGIGGTDVNRTTNLAGVASLSYNRDSDATSTETITADWGLLTDTAVVYWADATPADGSYTVLAVNLLVVDTDNDTVVVNNAGTLLAFTYDSGDQFRIVGVPSTQAAFEAALTDNDDLSIVFDADGVSAFDISANN